MIKTIPRTSFNYRVLHFFTNFGGISRTKLLLYKPLGLRFIRCAYFFKINRISLPLYFYTLRKAHKNISGECFSRCGVSPEKKKKKKRLCDIP